VLEQPEPQVLAHRCATDDAAVVALHNLGPEPVTVEVQAADGAVGLADLLGSDDLATDDHGRVTVALEGYGYRWLRLHPEGSARLP
jgi:hypothetical protein